MFAKKRRRKGGEEKVERGRNINILGTVRVIIRRRRRLVLILLHVLVIGTSIAVFFLPFLFAVVFRFFIDTVLFFAAAIVFWHLVTGIRGRG